MNSEHCLEDVPTLSRRTVDFEVEFGFAGE
jgi:hypothetical protein